MGIRILAAAAMLVPAASLAQDQATPAGPPVSVEVVSNGALDVPADAVTMNVTYSETGSSQAAADKNAAAALARIAAVAKRSGVPATAVEALPADVTTTLMVTQGMADNATVDLDSMMMNDSDVPDKPADPVYYASGGRSVVVGSWGAAEKLKAAFEGEGLTVSDPVGSLKDTDAARRQAKAKALRSARADADAYAAEMGMRVIRVARISEAGHNLILPGVQSKLEQMIFAGPAAMNALFRARPGYVHVEAGMVVEFMIGK